MNAKTPLTTATAVLIALCCTHSAQAARPGACALLNPAQVSSALGVPMSKSSFGADVNHCQWEQHGSTGKQSANAVLLIETAQIFDMLKRLRESGNSPLFVPASGMGDDAFYWGGTLAVTLFVKKGSTAFRVALNGQGWSIPQIKARERALAQAVLPKL